MVFSYLSKLLTTIYCRLILSALLKIKERVKVEDKKPLMMN